MRIRKRKVPLPISLLSPIPLTDPNLFRRSPVILVHTGDHLTCSDLHRSTIEGNNSSDHNKMTKSDLLVNIDDEPVPQLLGCLGIGGIESVQNSNNASNKSTTALGAATDSTSSNGPSIPPSNLEGKAKGCDVDNAKPMKKQNGSIDQITTKSIDNHMEKIENEDGDDGSRNKEVNTSNKKAVSKRGKMIMEGSRCSRVNGRGWRCCQQTLVGYSLCEHHLGKGRLRSMSSTVRGTQLSTKSKKRALGMSVSSEDCSPLMRLCEAAKKESDIMRKRVINNKVGVVKPRSLSSLLGPSNTTSSGVASEDLEVEKESKGKFST